MTENERALAARLAGRGIPWSDKNQTVPTALSTMNGNGQVGVFAFFSRRRVDLFSRHLLAANPSASLADLKPDKSHSTKQAEARNRIFRYALELNIGSSPNRRPERH